MAGLGSRFMMQNYQTPKPFIEFDGKMMIEHVLFGLALPEARYTLVIRREFQETQAIQLQRLQNNFTVDFVCVDQLTQGAACTALAAHRYFDHSAPILFADSDNIFQSQDIMAFVNRTSSERLDGGLLTFPSDAPIYSYAKTDAYGLVQQVREKKVISSHAIAGAYLFNRAGDFVDCAIDMLIYGDRQKGEYYMSNVYNHSIARGAKIGTHKIAAENFHCVGTPSQLEAFLHKRSSKRT